MSLLIVIWLGLSSLSADVVAEECGSGPKPSCSALEDCLLEFNRLPPHPYYTGGLDPEAIALSAGFEALQPPPIPELMGLLDVDDRRSRDIAAHALGRLRARTAIPALVEHLADTGWAGWALGAIADPAAIPPLVERLELHGAADALVRIGRPGIEALTRVLVDPREKPERRRSALNALTMVDSEDDVSAAVSVLRRALSTADADSKRHIMAVTRSFGPAASELIPEIREIRSRSKRQEDREDLTVLLVRLGDAASAGQFAERMWTDSSSTHMLLGDLGPTAIASVPTLLEVMRKGSWSQMADAAHALGLIRDPRASEALIEALAVPSWKVNLEAARALGRIGPAALEAALPLKAVSELHWSEIVRKHALLALRRIAGAHVPEGARHGVSQVVADHREEGTENHGLGCEPTDSTHAALDEPPRRQLSVGGVWLNVDDSFLPVPAQTSPLPSSAVLPPLNVLPHQIIFEVDNGWLVARDAGEWGGDINFVRRDGHVKTVFGRNCQGFVRLDGKLFALTGLAHLGMDGGALVELSVEGDAWHATPVVELPHAPWGFKRRRSAGRPDEVIVLSEDPASVTADGHVTLIPCRLTQ